ncbi:hypothetical protein CSUI_007303 [Cystoisospora suis]|uniref:Uncharacterized protein n=1 Tax=Cystoisospora suis TaxID=483139 RepID=A0A2C6JVR0_9APIC|nr:hypothetical protein CSUI_007303 [Cystoisospora suis]
MDAHFSVLQADRCAQRALLSNAFGRRAPSTPASISSIGIRQVYGPLEYCRRGQTRETERVLFFEVWNTETLCWPIL